MGKKQASRKRNQSYQGSQPQVEHVGPVSKSVDLRKKNDEVIRQLFTEAETALDSFLHESATESCKKILCLDPENIEAMEMLAGIYTELGSSEEAEKLWFRCIELSPDKGYKKYFALGQMSEGEESLNFYKKGISLLENVLEETENIQSEQNPPLQILKTMLSDGYCAIAELYMTDLCDHESARDLCNNAIEKSISTDPQNPDSYRIRASFCISEGNLEEAKVAMEKNLSFWFHQYEAMLNNPDQDPETEVAVPEYMTRVEISKLLVELEMFDEPTKILEGLLEEDDEVFIVWYVLGWLNYCRGENYLKKSHRYLKKAKEVAKMTGENDSDQAIHIDDLLETLNERGIQTEDDDVDSGSDTDNKGDVSDHDLSSSNEDETMES